MEPPRKSSLTETLDSPHTSAKNYADYSTSDKTFQLPTTLKLMALASAPTRHLNSTSAYSAELSKTTGIHGYLLHNIQRTHGQVQQQRKHHLTSSWAIHHKYTSLAEPLTFPLLTNNSKASKKPEKPPKRPNEKRKKPGLKTNPTTSPMSSMTKSG